MLWSSCGPSLPCSPSICTTPESQSARIGSRDKAFLRGCSHEPPTVWTSAVLCFKDPGGLGGGGHPPCSAPPQKYCTWVRTGAKPQGEGTSPGQAQLSKPHFCVSSQSFSTMRLVLGKAHISPNRARACYYPCKALGQPCKAEPSRVPLFQKLISLQREQARLGLVSHCR